MKKSLGALTWCFALPALAFAWSNPGHMAVAAVAYDELTPTERTKILGVLRQHQDLSQINSGFRTSPDDRSFFMAAATWPDLIRNDAHYTESTDDPYDTQKPAVAKIDYHDKLKHRGWHFHNTYFWADTPPAGNLPTTAPVNAVGVVKVLVGQIGSNEDAKEKAYDLMWLFHLVGDLHQPLHAVSAVSRQHPDGDHGGNSVPLRGVDGIDELHAFWDRLPGTTAGHHDLQADVATASSFVASLGGVSLGSTPNNTNPATWADESFALAKKHGYHFKLVKKPDGTKAELSSSYRKAALKDAKRRVKLAGHRLALILRDAFK